MCNCAKKNNLNEKYWTNEKWELLNKYVNVSYQIRYVDFQAGLLTQEDMINISQAKLLSGFAGIDVNGNKIEYAPVKWFCKFSQWLNENDCRSMGIDWNNTCEDMKSEICKESMAVIDKYGNRKTTVNTNQNRNKIIEIIDNWYDKRFNRTKRENKKKENIKWV